MGFLFALLIGLAAGLPAKNGMEFRTLAKGAFSGIAQPKQLKVNSLKQWKDLWEEHASTTRQGKPMPEVDFEKETVLAVFMGRQTHGGFSIEIQSLEADADVLKAMVTLKKPKKGAMSIAALTAPFHIIAIPKTGKEIKFVIREEDPGTN